MCRPLAAAAWCIRVRYVASQPFFFLLHSSFSTVDWDYIYLRNKPPLPLQCCTSCTRVTAARWPLPTSRYISVCADSFSPPSPSQPPNRTAFNNCSATASQCTHILTANSEFRRHRSFWANIHDIRNILQLWDRIRVSSGKETFSSESYNNSIGLVIITSSAL